MKHAIKQRPRCGARLEVHQRRREEILDKVAGLFAKHGYFETDTQFLADQLQVGKGTLYRYFVSKEEMFLAAVDRVMRKLHERIVQQSSEVEDPLDQIRKGIHAYLAFFAEHPEFVELLIQERALFKDRKKSTYFQHRDVYVKRWQELYRSMGAKGLIRDIPAERITDVIGDLIYGTTVANIFSGRRASPEMQTRNILDIVFFGILADSQRHRED